MKYKSLKIQPNSDNNVLTFNSVHTDSLSSHLPAGIENPAFMPDLDPLAQVQIPPWLAEAELDSSMVAPSQRAQVRLPWTPSNLRRLAPLRISTHSTDSFMLADAPGAQQRDNERLPPPPPPPPPPHRDDDHM